MTVLTPPLVLRSYQHAAVAAATDELAGADRATVVMACGTGKTVVCQRIAEQLVPAGGRVLVVMPTLALIEQTITAWRSSTTSTYQDAAFCSLSEFTAGDGLSIAAMTDASDLASWDARHTGHRRVVFTTYTSAERLEEFSALTGARWDLVICDEAHRTTGSLGRPFSAPLDDRVPAHKRLFVTATPRVHVGRGDEVASMDDEKVYGRRVLTYSLPQAIEDGWLASYALCVVAVDAADPRLLRLQSDEDSDVDDVAKAAALLEISHAHDVHRVVSFHNRVARAASFSQALNRVAPLLDDSPDVLATAISGNSAAEQRRAVMASLAGAHDDAGLHVVANARLLSEGVDVPTLDAVMIADPRSSAVEVTQIVGRAIRLNPARTHPSIIFVPIVIGPGQDPIDRLERSNFAAVHQTIQALGEHDPSFLAALAAPAGTLPAPPLDVMFMGPTGTETTDLAWTEHLKSLIISTSGVSWYLRAQAVHDFFQAHGAFPRPSAHDPHESRLGTWLGEHQRTPGGVPVRWNKRAGKVPMPSEHAQWLDKNLPGWDLTRDDQWLEMADQAIAHLRTHGTFSAASADPDLRRLRNWWDNQRTAARHGTPSGRELAPQRRNYLDQNLPGWDASTRQRWFETADELHTHVHTRGWPSTTADDPDAVRLARWINNIRYAAAGKGRSAAAFTPERRDYLDQNLPTWRTAKPGSTNP